MKGDIIEVPYQFSDVSLVGYQLVIPSLPFSSQLMDHKVESPYTLSNLTLKSIVAWIPRVHASYSAMLFVLSNPNLAVKGMH